LKYRSESGEVLNIIICAGLRSSVFQGYLLIDRKNLDKYFPSFPGNSIFLIDGPKDQTEFYRNTLTERFSGYGLAVSDAGERLASFFTVSNTYLEVFTILGIFGMILGVAGLGFVLIMNFNLRRREFAIMIATGYSIRQVRMILLTDYSVILVWGIVTGVLPAFVSTLGSLSQRAAFPFLQMILLISAIIITGAIVLSISASSIESKALVIELRKE
jgi:ABC-type antimicrobial peptide transport system permease subunit